MNTAATATNAAEIRDNMHQSVADLNRITRNGRVLPLVVSGDSLAKAIRGTR